MEPINCFLPYISPEQIAPVVEELYKTGMVDKIYLMTSNPGAEPYPGCEILPVDTLTSTQTILCVFLQRLRSLNMLVCIIFVFALPPL